jgi:DNA-binding beta-propeller fold protein YncE
VTAENGNTVSVVQTSDHKVVGTINVPRDNAGLLLKPKGIVVSPDGKRIYVATGRGNTIAVIDSERRQMRYRTTSKFFAKIRRVGNLHDKLRPISGSAKIG